MEVIEYYIENYNTYIIIGIISAIALLIILNIIQQVKLRILRKKYKAFMKSGDKDIEQFLIDQSKQMDNIELDISDIKVKQNKIENKLKIAFKRIGIVKYNAFKEMGGNLSYAIAILDDNNSGFIINGIHSREGSYTYIKAIENGKATANLSKEEEEALNKAIKMT